MVISEHIFQTTENTGIWESLVFFAQKLQKKESSSVREEILGVKISIDSMRLLKRHSTLMKTNVTSLYLVS